jgi:hypothetical protein
MRSWHGQYRLKLASAWLVGGVPGVLAFDKAVGKTHPPNLNSKIGY